MFMELKSDLSTHTDCLTLKPYNYSKQSAVTICLYLFLYKEEHTRARYFVMGNPWYWNSVE